MKKTLSRVLSLLLVLVLLVGVMPAALATEGEGETEPENPGTEETVTPSVTISGADKVLNGVETTLTATLTNAPEGYTPVYTWSGTGVTGDGSTAVFIAESAGPYSVSLTVSFTANTEGAEAVADVTATHSINVVEKPTITISPANATLEVGKTQKLTVSYEPDLSPAPTVTWTSSDPTVATVKDGVVTAVSEGKTTITASIDQNIVSNEVVITVSGGAYIDAENLDIQEGSSKILDVTLVGAPKDAAVKWTFTSTDKEISVSYNEAYGVVTVTGNFSGEASINVTATYTVGETPTVVTKTVYVGVYAKHTIKVTVDEDVSSFTFAETSVFDSIEYDGRAYNAKSSIESLIREDDNSYVAFSADKTSDGIGTLSIGKFNSSNEVDIEDLASVTLTMNGKSGTMDISYTLYGPHGVIVGVGVISVTTEGYTGDIVYEVGLSGTVSLNESDFATYFNKHAKYGTLDYVVFDLGGEVGTLYTNSNKTTTVKYNTKCYYKGSGSQVDLDAVTYVPYARAKEAYEDKITFTCYSTTYGVYVTGVMAIEVSLDEMNFTDVKKSDYFYDAVVWAVNNGVTTGTSATTFSPDAACTRAQVVTFLWRAAGEPAPKSYSNPFTDVKRSDYYYEAVLWAVEKGITTGTSTTTFSPSAACTRAQVVTFLYRAAGEPNVSSGNSFTDVKSGDYYYDAVRWAVKNGITTGTSTTTFGPSSTCTRGQIVTFLYRYYG